MGQFQSVESRALIQAKVIREELYSRVESFRVRNKPSFQAISLQKKTLILTSTATQLVSLLDDSLATCSEVMLSFIERTLTFGIEHNYVLDQMFDEAVQKAKKCDYFREQFKDRQSWKPGMDRKQCFPPFFGVPISIKQSVLMKGRQTYVGFVSELNQIPTEDTMIMHLIINMGFIPFVRSNVPQGVKTIETNNNIFGYCKNPWNPTRSAGGSSGGESGLVASYCSPIGLGSDIGGSLRVPADWNGLFTLKANGRISKMGNAYYGKYAGGSTVRGALGFLTKGTDDLVLTTIYLCDQENYKEIPMTVRDPYVHLKKFDDGIFVKKPKMKIGYLIHLKTLNCSPTHERAVLESKKIFESLGHQTVQVELPNFQKLFMFLIMINLCDGTVSIFDELRQGEPLIKQYRMFELIMKIPWLIRKAIIWLIKKKMPRVAAILENSRKRSPKQVFQEIYEHQHVISRQIYQVFAKNELDALLTPGFSLPAVQLGQVAGLQYCYPYASGWNVIHYPAGSVPITTVKMDQTTYTDRYDDIYTTNMRKAMKGSEGMPAGVQIVSLPYHQENILYLMGELEREVGFRKKHRIPF